MKKYKIALKYCGGCNPAFDRVKAVAGMLDRLANVVEIVPLDDESADILVAVEGCPTACADLSGFKGESIVVLSSREAVESFRPEAVAGRESEDRGQMTETGCRGEPVCSPGRRRRTDR